MRAISTVVDATLFLLILGVAVATIVAVPMLDAGDDGGNHPSDATDHADAIAEHLATGTARVEYSLAPAARAIDGDPPIPIEEGPPFARSAHGTYASLLADAAVARFAVDGRPIAADGASFAAAVGNATEERVRLANHSVAVDAVWEPYPDASISGQVHAGPQPPPTADVNAAAVTVDASFPGSRETAIAAARKKGYAGVADAVAESVVGGLFPPNRTRLAVRGDYPVDALVAHRYAQASAAFGGDPEPLATDADVAARNEGLAETLSERLEPDLRDRYGTPEAAARNVSTGTVTVTIRTWSR